MRTSFCPANPTRTRLTLTSAALALLPVPGCQWQADGDPAAGRDARAAQDEQPPETNLSRRPADQSRRPTLPPKHRAVDDRIELVDLGVVLRWVRFDKPIDGRDALWFSDAEITNEMYLTYLDETDQWRDDGALAKWDDDAFTVRETEDSGVITMRSISTADPAIGIHRRESLWVNGLYPEGKGDHPVTLVTIAEATGFCDWLTQRYRLPGLFRLPTEMEWLAATYGAARQYPWGDDEREWTSSSTEMVRSHPELRTPDGLFGLWGNVSELVLSDSDGYGGTIDDPQRPIITLWLGPSFHAEEIRGRPPHPRQDDWGYTHSVHSRDDEWGFRIVFVPREE